MNPVVYLENVWVRNLKGVTASIEGGITAIIGRNGSGKTTLLRVVTGDLRVERGRVRRPRRIGASWQNPYYSFYKDTVSGEINTMIESEEDSIRLLREHGLLGLEGRSPFTLSMGQARMLSILLATLWKPDLLVIDEPTSGLGLREKAVLSRFIRGLGIPVLLASHDLDFVLEVSDRVILLDDGRIIIDGGVFDVFYGDTLYEYGFHEPVAVSVGRRLGVLLRSVSRCL